MTKHTHRRSRRVSAVLSLGIIGAISVAGCASMAGGPVGNRAVPQPAKAVDLDRYLGRWYELYRYEAPFQRGCEAVTADYSLNKDGSVRVLNSCHQDSVTGKLRSATGKAKVVANSNGAKLRVSFFGPFYGDYWVLDRADDYSWSIVGEPSGRFLWVLSRNAKPDDAQRAMLRARVEQLGYDWALVRTTQHP